MMEPPIPELKRLKVGVHDRDDGFWANVDEVDRISEYERSHKLKPGDVTLPFIRLSWLASEKRACSFSCSVADVAWITNCSLARAKMILRVLQNCNAIQHSYNEDGTVNITILSEVRV
jgi:hypothetical protein